ncbi:MAG: DAK2 domain-containing protein [Chloroflexia bacterium]
MDQRAPGPPDIPVADIMETVAATMRQERGRLNSLSSFSGDAAHGDRMARAFTDAADAILGSGTGDAGEDLQLAGQVLTDPAAGYGTAAPYFGQGFSEAGTHFLGRRGLSFDDLPELLDAMLAGAQKDNPAVPGMGTLLDVLSPAAMAVGGAATSRLTHLQTIQGALGAAASGVRNTANMPQPFNRHPKGRPAAPTGMPDPGAGSAQTMLTGVVKGLLGDRVPTAPAGQNAPNFLLNLLSQGIDLGGAVIRPRPTNDVEAMLAGTAAAGRYAQPLNNPQPGYGKGTDVEG